MPTASPASQLCPCTQFFPPGSKPLKDKCYYLVCCVWGLRLSFLNLSTSLAYPVNRNWDPQLMRRGETQEQEARAVLILLTFKDFSGDRTGDQPLVKCTVDQHSHQQKHKADSKKRMCFQSHEALNHAAHKYLSPRFLFFLFPSVLKGWKGTPLTLTVTAVRREIFPHPCNPHNKKGLSCLSDKTGIPWHRGI